MERSELSNQPGHDPSAKRISQIQKTLRALQDGRSQLLHDLSELRQENSDLKALVAHPEAPAEIRRTQRDLQDYVVTLRAQFDGFMKGMQDKKSQKKDEIKMRVRNLELAVKLAGRRVDEIRETVRDI